MPTIQPTVIHGSKMRNQLLFDTCKKRIEAQRHVRTRIARAGPLHTSAIHPFLFQLVR